MEKKRKKQISSLYLSIYNAERDKFPLINLFIYYYDDALNTGLQPSVDIWYLGLGICCKKKNTKTDYNHHKH